MKRSIRFLALTWLIAAAPLAHAVSPTPAPATILTGNESVAVTDDASGVLYNPAMLGARGGGDVFLSWTRFVGHAQINHGVFAGEHFGFHFTRVKNQEQFYAFDFAGGGEKLRFGLTLGRIKSGLSTTQTSDANLGVLWRPRSWASFGGTVTHLAQPKLDGQERSRHYDVGAAFRPLAALAARHPDLADRLTLSADLIVPDDGEWSQSRARFGAELEPVRGILLRGTVADHGGTHVGIVLRWPHTSFATAKSSATGGLPRADTYSLSMHGREEASALAPRSDRRVAEIRLGGVLADETLGGWSLLGGGSTRSSTPAREQLERARRDPLTRGVLLELRGVAGMAQLEELRPRLLALRAAGKPVVAFLPEGAGRGDLYLASACDRIVSTPAASFQQLGLRAERRYYRELFASLGLRIDRTSIGAYKSAYRNYSVDSTSNADREVIEHTLDQAQQMFVDTLLASRPITRERLMPLLDGRRWSTAEMASAGAIDSVGYREDALRMLGHSAGLGARPRVVALSNVQEARSSWPWPSPIAVVYASGGIDLGESGNALLDGPFMGSTTLARTLDCAFHAPGVRVVLLRIESPGGSSLATDLIRHEIERLKRETGRPLVVSMGGAAASGGYEIALPGDVLFCDHATRTGSIGVLFVKPSLERFYAQHHVRQDAFQRGDAMPMGSLGHDWTPAEQASADSAIGREYHEFVAEVAAARHLPESEIEPVARGRVWLGDDALARHLVDRIGGFDQAVAEARRRAGVPEGARIRLLEFRRPKPGWLQRLIATQVSATLDREARLPESDGTYEWDDGLGGP